MLITAHGGALGTHRNSSDFFVKIKDYPVDVIEVDIWKWGKLLYLSHLPSLIPCLRHPLSYAFDFIKKYNLKINCDVKQRGLVKSVMQLAEKIGVTDRIIFTGSVCKKDIQHLGNAEVYLNKGFFSHNPPKVSDVLKIKKYMDSFNCDNIKGVNFKYIYCTDEFLDECKKHGVAVSVFVVDKDKEIERLQKRNELANITTNRPDMFSKIIEKMR